MISTTSEYALRAVAYLANNPDAPQKRETIADATGVPTPYLTKVMKSLEKAEILKVQRGPGGGYSLRKQPEQLSILEIVQAVETLWRVTQCPIGAADHLSLCPLHAKLNRIADMVERELGETMLSELLATQSRSEHCIFPKTDPTVSLG